MDESLVLALNGLAGRWPWLDVAMLALARPNLLLFPGILAAGAWVWWRWREAILAAPVLLTVFLLGDALGAQLKYLAARPRPCQTLSTLRPIGDFLPIDACGKTFGFPSNHAVNTAAVATFLQMLYPRSGWITWPLVVLIGVARVYLGAHYPTDVLGGWAIGALFGGGAAWLLLRWKRFRRSAG